MPSIRTWRCAALLACCVLLALVGCSAQTGTSPVASVVSSSLTSASTVELEQWRTVPVAAIALVSTCTGNCLVELNSDNNSYQHPLACGAGTQYPNPTDLQFSVPDYQSIHDATLTIKARGVGPQAVASVTCVDGAGNTLGTILSEHRFPAVEEAFDAADPLFDVTWDVPLSCFIGPTVTIRVLRSGSDCFTVDTVRLAVRSTYRHIRIASISSAGTCNSNCVDALNRDDGSYLEWIACSNGRHTATEYETPTDVRFIVPDHASVTAATVDLDVFGSGDDARVRVSCIDQAGNALATIDDGVRSYAPTPQVHSLSVPLACFTGPVVTIRLERLGANCLGADSVALSVASAAHSVPIDSVSAAGTCNAACLTPLDRGGLCHFTCVSALNSDDGSYLEWIACSNGENTSTEYDTPTDFNFHVPDHANISQASLAMDAFASGTDTRISVTCVDGAGGTLATIFTNIFPLSQTAQTYVWEVPQACLASKTMTVRVTRLGEHCLGANFLRLYTTSNLPRDQVFNDHGLEGYSDKLSVGPGEQIAFKVHSPAPSFSIEFRRLPLSATSNSTPLYTSPGLVGQRQNYPWNAYRVGAGWATSYSLTVPTDWKSGMYEARLVDVYGSQFRITFVVRESTPGTVPIAVLASTNTWNAYNPWGGASFYSNYLGDFSISRRRWSNYVSMARPNPLASAIADNGARHLTSGEQHILRWLEDNHYSYASLTDIDAHSNPAILTNYRAVIISTHSEYWTEEMYDALVEYLNEGGHLLYLGGNSVYWKVTSQGDQIEVRKDGTLHAHTGQPGGQWRKLGHPEAAVLGVAWDPRTYNPPTFDGPYGIDTASHWVFEGTELSNGDLVGKSGFTGPAAGWEMDDVVPGVSPPNVVVLAHGTGNQYASQMTYYDHPGGGGVFSVGSIDFGSSLVMNEHLTRAVMNVLGHFGISPNTVGSHHIVPVDSIPTAGTCTAACVASLNQSDGSYAPLIACSNGNNSATEYDNPTDFRFSVPDHADVSTAAIQLDIVGTGTDARAQIFCVDQVGNALATIQPETLYANRPASYRYPVPPACFASSTVTVRVQRTGPYCIGTDYIGLDLVTRGRATPISSIPTAGTCTSDCVSRLNQDDGDYVQWLACSDGRNTATEYADPTILEFSVPSFATVTDAVFELDARGSGSDADIAVTCVDSAGATLGTLQPATRFSSLAKLYRWNVPLACFTSSTVWIRLDRIGANCLAVDSAKLFPVWP